MVDEFKEQPVRNESVGEILKRAGTWKPSEESFFALNRSRKGTHYKSQFTKWVNIAGSYDGIGHNPYI